MKLGSMLLELAGILAERALRAVVAAAKGEPPESESQPLPWTDVKRQNDAAHVPERFKVRPGLRKAEPQKPIATECTACGGYWQPSICGPWPGERCPRCESALVSELKPPSNPAAN